MQDVGVGPMQGRQVPWEDALQTAMAGCGIALKNPQAAEWGEFRQMLVEWYFSGNWIEEDEDEA